LFGEDDLFLGRDYVSVLAAKLTQLDAQIVSGRLVYLWPTESVEEAVTRDDTSTVAGKPIVGRRLLEMNFDAKIAGDSRVPFTHSCFLTRTDLARRLRYDENYPGNGYREETDFQLKVLRHDGRVFITPHAICFHLPRSEAMTGGQRDLHWLVYEFWTIRNNHYFVRKHYPTLRAYFGDLAPEWRMHWAFMVHRWRDHVRPQLAALSPLRIRPLRWVGRLLPASVRQFLKQLMAVEQ
jgi:hypothetical protein